MSSEAHFDRSGHVNEQNSCFRGRDEVLGIYIYQTH